MLTAQWLWYLSNSMVIAVEWLWWAASRLLYDCWIVIFFIGIDRVFYALVQRFREGSRFLLERQNKQLAFGVVVLCGYCWSGRASNLLWGSVFG